MLQMSLLLLRVLTGMVFRIMKWLFKLIKVWKLCKLLLFPFVHGI